MKTAQEMIDAIRKGETFRNPAMQKIGNMLESQQGQIAEYKEHFEYNQAIAKERDQLRKVLGAIYLEDQHPNYDDPTSPIIGSLGKMSWKALNRTENGG